MTKEQAEKIFASQTDIQGLLEALQDVPQFQFEAHLLKKAADITSKNKLSTVVTKASIFDYCSAAVVVGPMFYVLLMSYIYGYGNF